MNKWSEQEMAQYAKAWAKGLCECAGEDEKFLQQFMADLFASPGVYGEYCDYLCNQTFSCAYKIQGVSLVDIMIWQIDHFKADLDKGQYDMRENGDKMLLMAFRTMLDMEKNPQPYLEKMGRDTGSDYPDKY